jgi:hypothetical protein
MNRIAITVAAKAAGPITAALAPAYYRNIKKEQSNGYGFF